MKTMPPKTLQSKTTIIVTIFCLACLQNVNAQPGTLDESFGQGGKVIIQNGALHNIALQQDGKILALGSTYNSGTAPPRSFLLARLNSDGSLDNSFGNNGEVITSTGDSIVHYPLYLKAWPGGNITIAGYSYSLRKDTSGGIFKIVLQQFNSNGLLDSSYGNNGTIIIPFGKWAINTITIQSDGKIVAGGDEYSGDGINDQEVFLALRFNADGTPDSSFGTNGVTTTKVITTTLGETGVNLVQQEDGRLILTGQANSGPSGTDFALVRYNTNGEADSSFNSTGIVTAAFGTNTTTSTQFTYFYDAALKACLQPAGKILAGGYSDIVKITEPGDVETDNDALGLMRFNASGTLDSSFALNGKLRLPVDSVVLNGSTNGITGIAIQQDSSIITTAPIYLGTAFKFFIGKFTANGMRDNSFGTNGFVVADFAGASRDVLLQGDNKIVAGGSSDSNMIVARFNNNTILPVTLINFTAVEKEKTVLLNWQTAAEINNNYFEVQRSTNGQQFNAIGTVKSNGNGATTQQYAFTDVTPANGNNYYRLKQVDLDGHFTFSKIVTAFFGENTVALLYPNPVKDVFEIHGLPLTKTTITVIGVDGKVLSRSVNYNAVFTGSVKGLSNGSYYVVIEGAGKTPVKLKFIKG